MNRAASKLLEQFKSLAVDDKKRFLGLLLVEHQKKSLSEARKNAARIQKEKRDLARESGDEPQVDEKKSKYYFTSDTQAAIVEYQSLSPEEYKKREEIYVTRIFSAFDKLAENLIIINRFSYLHESNESLRNDCANFLFETIRKFDASKGTNAFSYFNVVAKNWLIMKSRCKQQHSKRIVSLSGETSRTDRSTIEEHNLVPSQDVLLEHKESRAEISSLFERTLQITTNEDDKKCIKSLILVFSHLNKIDIQTKPAMLLYLRTITKMNNKQLATSLARVKDLIRQTLDDFEEEYDYGFEFILGGECDDIDE